MFRLFKMLKETIKWAFSKIQEDLRAEMRKLEAEITEKKLDR